MTEKENCEILFNYLKSILYDIHHASLDLSELDESYQKLGRGLQFLQKAVAEMEQYSADLSMGKLSGPTPSRDNFLCSNLKNLHANLNHLTWQAQQVANGDFSQRVSYLGDFSASFNTMIQQLEERSQKLNTEIEQEKQHSRELTSFAYRDAVTGIYNRRYYEENIHKIVEIYPLLSLCSLDLDSLKYVNDHFGHAKGDAYIQRFVELIQSSFRSGDILCRVGGDEFVLILPGCTRQTALGKFEYLLNKFVTENTYDFPISFSYGIAQFQQGDDTPIEEIMNRADLEMYKCKQKNHQRFNYQDRRY
jgi:diguanylate cyclase (GGDEF)-like protein